MFQEKAAMFLYGISPVHMGAGTALGAIDNPIQRERHTHHPMMAGSGLKGALRHELAQRPNGSRWEPDLLKAVFGPDTNASDHAGALSVADAQVVLFPVRSLRESYVYATCPTALQRLARLLDMAGCEHGGGWQVGQLGRDEAIVLAKDLLTGERLILEGFEFSASQNQGNVEAIAAWLAENAVPALGGDYFQTKVATHTVVLSDDRFTYFVRNSTVVEPHVRISDDTGTADDGGLFYTENVPPESVFVSLLMTSQVRTKVTSDKLPRSAADVLGRVREALHGKMVQVGGDATTGRGQMILSIIPSSIEKGVEL